MKKSKIEAFKADAYKLREIKVHGDIKSWLRRFSGRQNTGPNVASLMNTQADKLGSLRGAIKNTAAEVAKVSNDAPEWNYIKEGIARTLAALDTAWQEQTFIRKVTDKAKKHG